MINVSNSFKENIKRDVREIGGIAELVVSGGYYNASTDEDALIKISATNSAEITNLNSVTDSIPTTYKYARTDTNYTVLDGSFILANEDYTNKHTGYIGITTPTSLTIETKRMPWMRVLTNGNKKITIYFDEGYATDFGVELYPYYTDGQVHEPYTYSFTNNALETITIDGSNIPDEIDVSGTTRQFYCISKIVITINEWSSSNLRPKIKQVNFGETMLFENQDLIEMKMNEETSIDNINNPSNDCSIMLNNYDRKFNLINQDSVLNRLNKNSHIRTFVGVSLKGGMEYVDMGSYQYNSYTDNQDKTITLNGIGTLQSYEGKQNYLWRKGIPNSSVLTTIANMLNSTNNEVYYNGTLSLERTNTENERQQLQAIAIFSGSYIKENRDINARLENKISFQKRSDTIQLSIPLSIQTKEPKIIKKNKTKTIVIKTRQVNDLVNEEKVLYEGNVSDRYSVKVDLNSTSPVDISSIKVYEKNRNGTETLLSSDEYIVYNSYYVPRVQIYSLTSDDIVGIKIVGKEYNYIDLEKEITNRNISDGEIIEYNNNYLDSDYQKQRVANYVFNREGIYKYEFEIEFNGDPSLEVGDIISFETVDGWMKGFVESIDMKYNGGLIETIKGVCSNVL